jgi:hypothetical protein
MALTFACFVIARAGWLHIQQVMRMAKWVLAVATMFALAASSLPASAGGYSVSGPGRTARKIECIKQADAKGLTGQERYDFRIACKRGRTTS